MSNLLTSEDGTPHFPLFWSLEPRRVPGFDYDDLTFDEKIDVAFLRNSAPLDCGFLLENEDLPDRLRQILDKMPPKATVPRTLVNEKAMRRWLKEAGGEPDGQGAGATSHPQPDVSTSERRKKQRLDTQGEQQSKLKTKQDDPTTTTIPNQSTQQPITTPNPVLTQTGAYPSSRAQGPEGSAMNSIFDRRFDVERIVYREFSKKEDRTRVNKVGMRNVGKHLMTMGVQAAFLGHCFDSGMNSANKELKDRALKIKELTAKLQALESSAQTISSLKQSISEYENKLTSAENAKKIVEDEKKTAKKKYDDLNTQYLDVTTEQSQLKKDLAAAISEKNKACEDVLLMSEQKGQLEADLKALQAEIAIQHARGFRKAIEQVKVLNPVVNVEGVGVFKKIVNGKIVDESEDEDE
ncbi:hypothetical protein SESBI_02243 [Sesbania bispinosa]|nr:hypothetical protein SESBI_02243 [Sesbania bispinosa]